MVNITEIIDNKTIRIDNNLTDDISGNKIFVSGDKVNDFHYLDKDAIWTISTASIQEIDKQQQIDKLKIKELGERLAQIESMI